MPTRIRPPERVVEHVGIAIERLGIARSPRSPGLLLVTHLEPERTLVLVIELHQERRFGEASGQRFDLHPVHAAAGGAGHHHIGADEPRQGWVVEPGVVIEQPGVVALLAGEALPGRRRRAARPHRAPRVVRRGVDDRPTGVAHRARTAEVVAVAVRHRPTAGDPHVPVPHRDGLAIGAVGQRVRVVAQPGAPSAALRACPERSQRGRIASAGVLSPTSLHFPCLGYPQSLIA